MAKLGREGSGARDWREQIREELQSEIERQVREALDTPPLERVRRNTEKARLRYGQGAKSSQDLSRIGMHNSSVLSKHRRKLKKRPVADNDLSDYDEDIFRTPTWDDYSMSPFSLGGASEAQLRLWRAHRLLNAHVESAINDARKLPRNARGLFSYCFLDDSPATISQADSLTDRHEYRVLMGIATKSADVDRTADSASHGAEQDRGPRFFNFNGSNLGGNRHLRLAERNDRSGDELRRRSEELMNAEIQRDRSFMLRINEQGLKNFGALNAQEKQLFFVNFTKKAYYVMIRDGVAIDGCQYETSIVNNRKIFRDRFGLERDEFGPFWPKECGPLHPTPVHKRLSECRNQLTEPVLTSSAAVNQRSSGGIGSASVGSGSAKGGRCVDTLWRSAVVVFDIDKSDRDCMPTNGANTIGASAGAGGGAGNENEKEKRTRKTTQPLWFESRFECGNLRQARRIADRTYELILNTDVNTSRHTQWYYFRVRNMTPGVTYRFIITNFMKPNSLYNQGMQPLIYSEKRAEEGNFGWFRCGHSISYARNVNHRESSLLVPDDELYQLDFCMEFPHEKDVCYIAHCYPYGFTDLKRDLDFLLADPQRAACMKRSVLCETAVGNACFLLTITNFADLHDTESPPNASEEEVSDVRRRNKKVAVISARVHPGESNSSWVMKGLIEYLSSDDPVAVQLRDSVIFTIIPMLNPDGVIVGNYRCSLTGRDLNRNYRHPNEARFPTVWHTKELVRQLSKDHEVVLYCDLHGHSRMSGSFLYGCGGKYCQEDDLLFAERRSKQGTAEGFLEERLFPWLMASQSDDGLFSFDSCKYAVKKCKEATGRVVMWRQLGIDRSFTLEVSFCGTQNGMDGPRHFCTTDLEKLGARLAKCVFEYTQLRCEESRQRLQEVYGGIMRHFISFKVNQTNEPSRTCSAAASVSQSASGIELRVESQQSVLLAQDEQPATSQNAPTVSTVSTVSSVPIVPTVSTVSTGAESNEIQLATARSTPAPSPLYQQFELIVSQTMAEDEVDSEYDSNSDADRELMSDDDVEIEQIMHYASEPMRQPQKKIRTKNTKSLKRRKSESKRVLFQPPSETSYKLPAASTEAKVKTKGNQRKNFVDSLRSQDPEVSSRVKISNPIVNGLNGGIPCFALKRALDRTEVKLEKLREKLLRDPEKSDLVRNEYLSQIAVLRNQLRELTALLPQSPSMTIVLGDELDYDSDDGELNGEISPIDYSQSNRTPADSYSRTDHNRPEPRQLLPHHLVFEVSDFFKEKQALPPSQPTLTKPVRPRRSYASNGKPSVSRLAKSMDNLASTNLPRVLPAPASTESKMLPTETSLLETIELSKQALSPNFAQSNNDSSNEVNIEVLRKSLQSMSSASYTLDAHEILKLDRSPDYSRSGDALALVKYVRKINNPRVESQQQQQQQQQQQPQQLMQQQQQQQQKRPDLRLLQQRAREREEILSFLAASQEKLTSSDPNQVVPYRAPSLRPPPKIPITLFPVKYRLEKMAVVAEKSQIQQRSSNAN